MDDLHAAGVLHELQIPCASSKPSGTGVPQCISGTLHNTAVVKLKSAVLITNLSDFSSDALHTPVPKPAVVGVAVSPCSSMVAAYSTDALYFARLNGDGQLHEAGQLAGIKSVQWCPGRAALAVFYQQVTSMHGVTDAGRNSTAVTHNPQNQVADGVTSHSDTATLFFMQLLERC
eukprot:GHUV01038332.1.p1 GENE.GHUV01038332.1~~GHUV01038332.1.p1  ORF type:complete len:175 (+),score=31.03 GHUV01038332.1:883-1407(+)